MSAAAMMPVMVMAAIRRRPLPAGRVEQAVLEVPPGDRPLRLPAVRPAGAARPGSARVFDARRVRSRDHPASAACRPASVMYSW